MRGTAYKIALLVLSALSLCSCVHKELCLHHVHETRLRIVFNWQNASEANPGGMCVYFYPVDGGSPIRFDFNGKDGGEISLPMGEYNLLAYNNDNEAVMFANTEKMEKHIAFTREGDILEPVYGNGYKSSKVPRPMDASNERVVITPDMIWAATATAVKIEDAKVTYTFVPLDSETESVTVESREMVIMVYPHELLCNYTYEVRNVKYLRHVVQVCGSLSGMAGMMTVAGEELGRECVTLPFAAVSDRESKITGQFYTFGHNEENDKPHRMTFYVWMDDGNKYVLGSDGEERFNVTRQIHEAPDRKRVHIIIDGLDLPKPIENGGGYKPSVDNWGEVYEDVIM